MWLVSFGGCFANLRIQTKIAICPYRAFMDSARDSYELKAYVL